MCGRAYEYFDYGQLKARYEQFRFLDQGLELRPNYNLAPTQQAPILRLKKNVLELSLSRWGMIPKWAPDMKSATRYALINAKIEDIETKRSYSQPFRSQRCIVPLSGFFEWKGDAEAPKRPFAFQLIDEPIMSVAGIWEEWSSSDSLAPPILSFAILTTSANELVRPIHARMPVILTRESEAAWLDSDLEDIGQIKELISPIPAEKMAAFEISARVNSPRQNDQDLLIPTKLC